ncbi:MAG: glycosyl hydrolase [Pedobacter sp.]|nr:glycosyl hydrolase [Pedobacter sp.]MDQ8052296.1 glycosyl hydrolase [Pedobacter sp.]
MHHLDLKKAGLAFLSFAIIGIGITAFKSSEDKPPAPGLDWLKQHFAAPGKEYGTAPLWVWNTKVNKKDIDAMLIDFKKTAFGGVFIHPRPGLITEYLSSEWFDLTRYAVQRGKELGLNVWIYDENSYPSGFAGGNVQHEMPESYNQGQNLSLTRANQLPDTAARFFQCYKKENGELKNITTSLGNEMGRKGEYYLISKRNNARTDWNAGFPYVDLMVKGVTEKFIDLTLNGYKRAFGTEFGKTVPGVFSDEMTIQVQGNGNVRWTPDLFSSFEKKWGYRLQDQLVSLFEEVGDWKKVRHNYYHTLLNLYIDRWSKPYSAYAAKNNLIWTGHYYEHSWPNPYHTPDNMAMYAWHQMPGIDMLFNEYNEKGTGPLREVQFGNLRAVRELASVANQLGKKRTLSESYAGEGWEVSLKDLKRLGDWEYALGVNFLCQHLSDMTIKGSRKYDYPQSFSYQNPWFRYYRELNLYYARLSMAMSQGIQRNDILVLEPTTSGWMYALFGKPNKNLAKIGERFSEFVTTLEKSHVEYDLGSENIIQQQGSVQGKRFVIGRRAYATVVVPPGMENIDSKTLQLLTAYEAAGGKVISFEALQRVDGAESDQVETFNRQKENIVVAKSLDKEIIAKYLRPTGIAINTEKGEAGGNIYHQKRWLPDGQLIFLANADMKQEGKGELTFQDGDALVMDLFTGKISDYPEKVAGSSKTVSFTIPPAGSLLLFIANKKQTGYPQLAVPKAKVVLSGTDLKVLRPLENSLMVDFCDVAFGKTELKDQFIFNAADTVYKYHGFKHGNPWDHTIQFRSEILNKQTFKKGSGFTATYYFDVHDAVSTIAMKAVVEQAALYSRILINGNEVKPTAGQWWLDKEFNVLEIGKYVKPGKNSLTLIADPMQVLAEIQPIYILGNFDVVPAAKGWAISPPSGLKLGGWKAQGLPLYGQGVTYRKNYQVDNLTKKHEVKLDDWKGTVAVVKVNGVLAGTIAFDPFALDVSRYLKKGSNEISIEIIGSLKNLLGPHHSNPPSGYVAPALFRKVTGYPSGNSYQTLDYGLFKDFDLLELKF